MKKVVLHIYDRFGCPFRYDPPAESGFIWVRCTHPNATQYQNCATRTPSPDNQLAVGFPVGCPLKDNDVKDQK